MLVGFDLTAHSSKQDLLALTTHAFYEILCRKKTEPHKEECC